MGKNNNQHKDPPFGMKRFEPQNTADYDHAKINELVETLYEFQKAEAAHELQEKNQDKLRFE